MKRYDKGEPIPHGKLQRLVGERLLITLSDGSVIETGLESLFREGEHWYFSTFMSQPIRADKIVLARNWIFREEILFDRRSVFPDFEPEIPLIERTLNPLKGFLPSKWLYRWRRR